MIKTALAFLFTLGLLASAGCMSSRTSDVNGAQATGATNDDAAGGADN